MCDDFGSDSGSFDDVGSSDFSSDYSSDFDSDVSTDFDTDYSSDIDTMDFDDVETIDFDDDISSDCDTSDISDDIDTMDFDDVETIDFDDDISGDFDSDIETLDMDDDLDTLDIDDDIETIDIDDDIDSLEFDDDIDSLDIDEDIETLDIDDDIESLDFDEDIETLDIEDDTESLDFDEDIETLDIADDVEDMDMEDISEDSFEIEEDFDDSEMDVTDEEAEFESEIEEMTEEFDDFDEADTDEISEDFEFDDEGDDIDDSDVVEDIIWDDFEESDENPDDSDAVEEIIWDDFDELNEDVDDSDDGSEEFVSDSDDSFEAALTDLETENSDPGDIPTYIDADDTTAAPETIDWDSMLSDGDRDYINGIMNNDNYTQEQKDFLINEHLSEVYERETAEPEYGARVKGLTYDGTDIITKPPEEDYSGEAYIDESLLDDALNNGNLSAENLSNLRDYLENVSNDDSLTDDEKSFLINQALSSASEINGVSYEANDNPSIFEGIKGAEAPIDVTDESIDESVNEGENEGIVNEYNEPFSGELSEEDIDTVYEGLSEYDFHGVDCLEDTERLDSSLENFTAENWENLSIDEQKEHMTDLAQYIIDVTGLENPPKIEFYNSGKDGDYGGFNRATNTLSINEHMLYQNDEAADTVAHELWHAYQYERASNPSTKLDYMYLENFNDYITPGDDFEGYQSQILESEARAFAEQIKDRLNSY